MMTEALLHYVWKNRLYDFSNLTTVDNHSLKVIHQGFPHHDAGPDFKQVIIKIDEIIWAGDVEIHINSSDWFKHHHEKDDKYLSVILHVVYNHDVEVQRTSSEFYPTLELKNFISPKLLEEYEKFYNSKKVLPCENSISEVKPLVMTSFLSSMVMERMLSRQKSILEMNNSGITDWNEIIYRLFAVSFGFSTNATPFEMMAKSLPYKYIIKHYYTKTQTYALIFGQAGMLKEPIQDEYYEMLQNEYNYLQYKYRLIPIDSHHWNLLRLRPHNFPAIRLAQFSELLHQYPDLFQIIINELDVVRITQILTITPHEYWQTHRHFGKETKPFCATIGAQSVRSLLINAIVPILFAYGSFIGNEDFQERAMSILEKIEFENNNITRQYINIGFPASNALFSQGIIQLYHHYCQKHRCLDCHIGCDILKR